MTRFRTSIIGLMAAVVAFGVNFAVLRSFDPSSPNSMPHFLFACGILPIASLLIVLALLSAAKRAMSPFLAGFELAGWAGVFMFLTYSSIATDSLIRGLGVVGQWIQPVVVSWARQAPAWALATAEFGIAMALFTMPQLLLAMLGGWLARRSGITVRLQLRCADPLPVVSTTREGAEASTDDRTKAGADVPSRQFSALFASSR